MIRRLGRVHHAELLYARADETLVAGISAISQPFDCFVVISQIERFEDWQTLIDVLALKTFGWVEVFGSDSEDWHDAIDRASVRLGRQRQVGDGKPMTTWDEELTNIADVAAYIVTGGQGDADARLLVFVGTLSDEASLLNQLRNILSSRDS